MHINMSLFHDGKNIFADEKDKMGLSKEAYYFIGGLMKHMKGITALTNPLVNSYKRLVPGYEAPVYIAWSTTNRSPLIQISAGKGAATKVELRSPDSAANPYLALAVCLEAGLDGIRNKIMPPKNENCNLFEISLEECHKKGIEVLPGTLYEAVQEMEKDPLIKKVLGEDMFTKYVDAKHAEWDESKRQITQWELDQYLFRF